MKINGVNPTLNARATRVESVQPVKLVDGQVEAASRRVDSHSEQKLQGRIVNATVVQEAVEEINSALKYMNERLEFSVHEATNRIVVRVLDRETEEVLREIPPEQILDLVAKLWELVGLLVDKRA